MISKELSQFIADFFTSRNLKLDESVLKPDTEVYSELGLYDMDVDLFIADLLKKFNIDDSNFNRKEYFGTGFGLIDKNVKPLEKIFGKQKWIPLEKEQRKPFSLAVLDKAISTGQLI